jgi:hypothetical protein
MVAGAVAFSATEAAAAKAAVAGCTGAAAAAAEVPLKPNIIDGSDLTAMMGDEPEEEVGEDGLAIDSIASSDKREPTSSPLSDPAAESAEPTDGGP